MDATSCRIKKQRPNMSWADPWMDYGWGNTPLNGNQADVKFSMLGQHTFYLDCLGPGGITCADVETHQVNSATCAADITDSRDPTTTSETFTVNWTTTNATSCRIKKQRPNMSWADPWMDYGWGNTPLNGNQADVKFSMLGQHTFYLDCLGPGGITCADVETHQVNSATFTADITDSRDLGCFCSVLFKK